MNDTIGTTSLEILTLEVAGRRCGLALADVREIVPAVTPMPLPDAPPAVEGVINLRGRIVPVLDLRRRLGLLAKPLEHTDHLVITQVDGRPLALRVDRAVGLARLSASEVEDLGPARVARLPEGLVLLHDLRALLPAPTEGGEP